VERALDQLGLDTAELDLILDLQYIDKRDCSGHRSGIDRTR
jgi:hypothetical protein